ncbi:MAG: archease [Betaproteobacteria bacterium]|nr:archease [Betaproteobacteria bacterium]
MTFRPHGRQPDCIHRPDCSRVCCARSIAAPPEGDGFAPITPMTDPDPTTNAARWEHFAHEADIGVRGFGPDLATAFAQAAIALTAVVCDPVDVKPLKARSFECEAPDREMLLVEWLDALANRQILTHLTREAFREVLPQADMPLLYDLSHHTCKVETHDVDGRRRALFVHRKGATRAFGPGHPDLPDSLRAAGRC